MINITINDDYVNVQIDREIYDALEQELKDVCEEGRPLQTFLLRLFRFLAESSICPIKYSHTIRENLIRSSVRVDPVIRYKLDIISKRRKAIVSYLIREYLCRYMSNLEQILNSTEDPIRWYCQNRPIIIVISPVELDRLNNALKHVNCNKSSAFRRIMCSLIMEYERDNGRIEVPDEIMKQLKAKE